MEIRLKENKKIIVDDWASVNYDRRQAKDEDGKLVVQLDKEGNEIWDVHINNKNFKTSSLILDCDLDRLEGAISKYFLTHHNLKVSNHISITQDEMNSILTIKSTSYYYPKACPQWSASRLIGHLLANKEITVKTIREFEEVAERAVSAILERMVK